MKAPFKIHLLPVLHLAFLLILPEIPFWIQGTIFGKNVIKTWFIKWINLLIVFKIKIADLHYCPWRLVLACGKCHLVLSIQCKFPPPNYHKKNWNFYLFFLSLQNSVIWWLFFHTTAIRNIWVQGVCMHWIADHLTLGLKLQPCNLPGGEVWLQVITFTQVQTTEQVMAQSGVFSCSFLWGKQKKGRKLFHVNVSSCLLTVCARVSGTFPLTLIH